MLLKIIFTNVTRNGPKSVTQNLFHESYTKQTQKDYSKLVPQLVLKIGFTSIAPNQFLECYSKQTQKRSSKLVTQALLEVYPEKLLKIGFTSVTQNKPKNVTQNWFHEWYSNETDKVIQNWFYKHYSILLPLVLLEIDPQTLLTTVTQTCFQKSYSKLVL